jgi:hypothetical protein
MPLQCASLQDRLTKLESNCQLLGAEGLHAPSAQNAAVGRPLISLFAHCCGSLSSIISYSDYFLSRTAPCCVLASGGVVEYDGPDH